MLSPAAIALAAAILAWCVWYPMLRSWRSLTLVVLLLVWTYAAVRLDPPAAGLAVFAGWAVALGLVAWNHPPMAVHGCRSQSQDIS